MTHFCLNGMSYKKQTICTDEMLNLKVSVINKKVTLPQQSPREKIKIISSSTQWFLLDIAFCYGIILTVLTLFTYSNAPIIVCKIAIIPMLVCPYFMHSRNPKFGNLSTYWYIWYWYALRFYDMFCNEHFFRSKSYLFCWSHAGLMKNMQRASMHESKINVNAFCMCLLNAVFMLRVLPYLFDESLPSLELDNICQTAVFGDILLKIMRNLLFVISLLYAMDYGGVFFVNLIGYEVEFDMKSPWRSCSLREFWGKRWNQFVATAIRKMVCIPIVEETKSKSIALVIVFVVLGILHSFPMWLDGFEMNVCLIVFIWFALQPLCMSLQDTVNRRMGYKSKDLVNQLIQVLLTFGLLFGSLVLSSTANCFMTARFGSKLNQS